MYQTLKVYSINYVFQNPETKEYASLFVHNITNIIVTNKTVINTVDAGHVADLLKQMGFTNRVHDGKGNFQNIEIE